MSEIEASIFFKQTSYSSLNDLMFLIQSPYYTIFKDFCRKLK
ncbi:hypothetical protein STRDD13_00791 [Streptococcus sp. DD13]|nr:hypothetical protein STRDD13_00791 [Streptococcus sp. DD13]